MTFELEADGIRIWCKSPVWTQKLVDKGLRLVDASQAGELRRALESPEPGDQPLSQAAGD
jgi:hypothetical protein